MEEMRHLAETIDSIFLETGGSIRIPRDYNGGENDKVQKLLEKLGINEFKDGLADSNYKELNILYEKYKDQGFEILAFPYNQFLWQEPGTNEEIQQTVCTKFKDEFPVFEKVTTIVCSPEAYNLNHFPDHR
ncbi:hypothetical protein RDI58_019852 [Solanum bulbocastanum]|uniref:Uncharacterized protein n=1 Tax=Solanum bulbocastanum TaxID=147425 RepID=A0AAN8TB00_SOLBU